MPAPKTAAGNAGNAGGGSQAVALEDHDAKKGDKEPFFMRMTPMELDVSLQVAENVFRGLLAGKRVPLTKDEDISTWEKKVLGEAWSEENDLQRKEVLHQMKEDGENSPMWTESVCHMGDIAWEVFKAGQMGEVQRAAEDIDRAEIMQQLTELLHKVKMSYYAKCGAGNRYFGLRACIAMFRIYIRDSELLQLLACTLNECIKDHEYNRDTLTCLTVPAPPLERSDDFKDRGWSFLRVALDAFIVQAGGQRYDASLEEAQQEQLPVDKDAAVRIAECIVYTKRAPAVLAQLKLVHEAPPPDSWMERRELRVIIPTAIDTCEELQRERPSVFLQQLREMLVEGREFMERTSTAEG